MRCQARALSSPSAALTVGPSDFSQLVFRKPASPQLRHSVPEHLQMLAHLDGYQRVARIGESSVASFIVSQQAARQGLDRGLQS